MSCDEKLLDCKDCDCKAKKKKFTVCCPKNCRCMTDDEHDAIKKGLGDKPKGYNYKGDDKYIEKVLEAQYKPDKTNDGCKISRAKCQKKSKCLLLSYNESKSKSKKKGCCHGQTGHHILPGSIFCPGGSRLPTTSKALKKLSNSEKTAMIAAGGEEYSQKVHNNSPTICVAGSSHSIGSHGWMHSATKIEIQKLTTSDNAFNLENVIGACTKAHEHVYKECGCDEECMKQTLREEYEGMSPKYEKDGSSAKESTQKEKLLKLFHKLKENGVKISDALRQHLGEY